MKCRNKEAGAQVGSSYELFQLQHTESGAVELPIKIRTASLQRSKAEGKGRQQSVSAVVLACLFMCYVHIFLHEYMFG